MGHLWLQGLLGSWVSCLGREEAGTACRGERCQGLQETLSRQGRGLSPTQQGSPGRGGHAAGEHLQEQPGCSWTEEPSQNLEPWPWSPAKSGLLGRGQHCCATKPNKQLTVGMPGLGRQPPRGPGWQGKCFHRRE